jgi:hypothetical protein
MKNTLFTEIISHPVTQLLCFLFIPIMGEIFVAPYGWYTLFAFRDGQGFAIIGVIAIALTLISLFTRRFAIQLISLILMWASLTVFYSQSSPDARRYTFQYALTDAALLLFVFISFFVILKQIRWKNY